MNPADHVWYDTFNSILEIGTTITFIIIIFSAAKWREFITKLSKRDTYAAAQIARRGYDYLLAGFAVGTAFQALHIWFDIILVESIAHKAVTILIFGILAWYTTELWRDKHLMAGLPTPRP